MSHFTVAVIKHKDDSLEGLLQPYYEGGLHDLPSEYIEFRECDESEIKEYEEHKEKYENLDEFMENYHGYVKNKETGKYGYYFNPNAHWDWYQVGGRWSNALLLKNGQRANYGKLKDIDWEKMKEASKIELEKVWDSNPDGIHRYFNGIRETDTKESFIERECKFTTYAVITPDGNWHSKGEMGWFGMSSESDEEANDWNEKFYDTFIKNTDPELEIVIVDCHI